MQDSVSSCQPRLVLCTAFAPSISVWYAHLNGLNGFVRSGREYREIFTWLKLHVCDPRGRRCRRKCRGGPWPRCFQSFPRPRPQYLNAKALTTALNPKPYTLIPQETLDTGDWIGDVTVLPVNHKQAASVCNEFKGARPLLGNSKRYA